MTRNDVGQWNRASRKSGGNKTIRIPINRNDAELLLQEARVRAEFGEEGVKAFWEAINKRAEADWGER